MYLSFMVQLLTVPDVVIGLILLSLPGSYSSDLLNPYELHPLNIVPRYGGFTIDQEDTMDHIYNVILAFF